MRVNVRGAAHAFRSLCRYPETQINGAARLKGPHISALIATYRAGIVLRNQFLRFLHINC
jgi:hypothetical protein